jgi:hypothetical protein
VESNILTINAHELTPYRFGTKFYTDRIRKYFVSEMRFEPVKKDPFLANELSVKKINILLHWFKIQNKITN